jgi:hypothetical protein
VSLRITDRLLLPLRLARARRRGVFREERELGEPRIVEGFALDFPEGEAAYNAIGADANGAIWFAVGTKSRDVGARLFRFGGDSGDWRRRTPHMMADLDRALETSRALAHGKVHVDLVDAGAAMLSATHVGYYDLRDGMERPAREHYPGGWFFAIENDRITPLAQAPAGEGIITMSADLARGTLFAFTWPSGLFLTLDLGSRTLRNHGPVFGAGEHGSKKDGSWSRVCRSIGVDPHTGVPYWSNDTGTIFRANEAVATTPRKEMWRKVLWHDGAFYGTLWQSSALIRFDPQTNICEEIGSLAASNAAATLALTRQDNTIHTLATGPGIVPQLATTVLHKTHDLTTNTTTTSGPLRLSDGRHITQSQSLLLHGDHAYSLCWVEVPNSDRSPRADAIRRLRRDTAEYRTRGYAEEMMLIRFAIR